MTEQRSTLLKAMIRDVPDFPKPGIVFKDITPILADAQSMAIAIDLLSEPWTGKGVTHVIAIESRGFIFGSAVALRLAAGFVPVRKPGKLPSKADRVEYALEYGTDAVEMHVDALDGAAKVLVVDDLIATGGTAAAAIELARRRGATILGASFLIELAFLKGREKLSGVPVQAVLTF